MNYGKVVYVCLFICLASSVKLYIGLCILEKVYMKQMYYGKVVSLCLYDIQVPKPLGGFR
jgi:hypothetical protein